MHQPATTTNPEPTPAQVRSLTEEIAGHPATGFLRRRSQLTTAAATARELLAPEPTEETSDEATDDLGDWIPQLPDLTDLL